MATQPPPLSTTLGIPLLVFLFAYTGSAKLLDPVPFRAVLEGFPLIGTFAPLLGWLLPATELSLAVLLLVPRTRRAGLWGCGALLLLFTLYISVLLLSASRLPCSCGGVLGALGWPEHWLLNLFFLGLTWLCLRDAPAAKGRPPALTPENSTALRNNRESRKPANRVGLYLLKRFNMKKNLLGLLALVLAVGLSAFTTIDTSTAQYYWFRQSDHELVGSSAGPDGNPIGCSATGSNCVKGYLLEVEPEEEPTTPPDAQFSFNP